MLTPGGDAWGIKRRFSAFKELRRSKEKDPSVTALPFPERVEAVAGKDSVDATASRQRQEQVQTWVNALLGVCPGDPALASFLARDGSVRASYARDVLGVVVSEAELAADNGSQGGRVCEPWWVCLESARLSKIQTTFSSFRIPDFANT